MGVSVVRDNNFVRISLSEAERRLNYLNEILSSEFSNEFIHTLLMFVLTFSTFESIYDYNRKTNDHLKKLCKASEQTWTKPYFDFFVKRYVSDGNTNSKFREHFQTTNDEEFVKKHLLNALSATCEDMLLSTFKISYRFRNNLLHGNSGKASYELSQYEECFNEITGFMQNLMWELLKREETNVTD
jgi:hypothetical protein